jgi:hypothetical protein
MVTRPDRITVAHRQRHEQDSNLIPASPRIR